MKTYIYTKTAKLKKKIIKINYKRFCIINIILFLKVKSINRFINFGTFLLMNRNHY